RMGDIDLIGWCPRISDILPIYGHLRQGNHVTQIEFHSLPFFLSCIWQQLRINSRTGEIINRRIRMLRPVGEAFEGTGKCGGVRPDKFQLPGALYRMGSDRYREIEPASIHLSTRLSENDKRTFIWTEFQGNGCTVAVILKLWQVPNRTLYTIPPFGLFTGDPEGRLNGNVLITLVGDEIDITVFQFPVEEYHRIRFFRTHIGLHSYPREGFLQTNPVKYHPFAVLVFSNGFSVDMAPELPRQFLHLLI